MQKLILFDIDGTLVHGSVANAIGFWQARVVKAITTVFHVKPLKPDPQIYNGFVDRNMMWFLSRDAGVTKTDFDNNYLQLTTVFHELTRADHQGGHVGWKSIPDAVSLLSIIKESNKHAMGVITGNTESNGWYKLDVAGIKNFFEFGAFADSVEDRLALAHHAVQKSKKHFGKSFPQKNIVVVGDTKHDVRAGKAIGAMTVAVLTGLTETKESLQMEQPDLLVDSLMDEQVLNLLGL